jgi:hypothetical protein
MKKLVALVVFMVLLYSCTVHKKQYYIFDRYVVHPKVEPAIATTPGKLDEFSPTAGEELITNDESSTQTIVPEQARPRKNKSINTESIQATESTLRLVPTDTPGSPLDQKIKQRKNGNGILYFASALIGLATLITLRIARPVVTKMTRWAKANPKKTQGLITGIQLPLLGLGVMNGYNLDQLGYEISDTSTYLFGTLMTIGFLTIPFVKPNMDVVTIPKKVNRQRLSYLSITLASLMMTVGVGNNLSNNPYNSRVISTVSLIDQVIFSDNQNSGDSNVYNSSDETVKKNRRTVAAISGVAAFFLILLLVVTTCAGVCLTIAGFGGAFSTGNAFAVLGGLLITALSILGIDKVSKASKKSKIPVSK